MKRSNVLLVGIMILPLCGCEAAYRVVEATTEAVVAEFQPEPPAEGAYSIPRDASAQNHAMSKRSPPVSPSITRPAEALDLGGWAAPEMPAPTPSPAKPQTLIPLPTGSTTKHTEPKTAKKDEHVEWAYAGPFSPENWGGMAGGYATCGNGKAQSPIDLASAKTGPLPPLEFHYREAPLEIVNSGHTIVMPQPPGSWLNLDGARYDLQQVHLHVHGEHALNGEFAAMEVHFVHQNLHGQLAVLGVMVQPGRSQDQLAEIAHFAPKPAERGQPNAKVSPTNKRFDPMSLIPQNQRYARYVGSLTTPPCSEGVAWHVLLQPIAAAKKDIEKLSSLMPFPNARPLQAINGRNVIVN